MQIIEERHDLAIHFKQPPTTKEGQLTRMPTVLNAAHPHSLLLYLILPLVIR
jgi:hypothetical protein